MNIAIIGTGNVGTGLARVLSSTPHGVILASRNPAKARATASSLSEGRHLVQGGSVTEAVAQAEVVVLAVPFDAARELASSHGFAGKIVIDPTNPLKPDYSGLLVGHDTSAAEIIAAAAPQARVVKGFNTLFAQLYEQGPTIGAVRIPVFLAGDNVEAKGLVSQIAGEGGFEATDVGGLVNARYLEPLAFLNIQLGYALGHGTQIAPAWLRR